MTRTLTRRHLAPLAALVLAAPAAAHDAGQGGIVAAPSGAPAPFEIVRARVTANGHTTVFAMTVSGVAGDGAPPPVGALAGAGVYAYVWPTTLDPATVGFATGAGLLALAVTAHPDFDDTPLFDEDGDGDPDNDGGVWHSHWVVLGPDPACGEAALKVLDIPDGAEPRLPATWPGLPLLIDSPGWQPIFSGDTLTVRVAFDEGVGLEGASFDAVTAGLRVHADLHAPLLCVEDVFAVASGDLSLPGRIGD